ncbi:MAG: hypothetical protein EBT91_01970 [Rhodobacteraceae bacterium]|nr:hypothetical protein [Paracoccaceae bacterium]
MVGSSKILTVSYGTFSCTLEGFDDSFDTMKAIAEYFRDLAADDRYFGAEPPTPDADMLARIAEREIDRRVEARMESSGIVLRAAIADEARAAPAPQPVRAEAQPAPETATEPAAEEIYVPPMPAPRDEPATVDAESVAAKLQRIRAVVGRSATAGASESYVEDLSLAEVVADPVVDQSYDDEGEEPVAEMIAEPVEAFDEPVFEELAVADAAENFVAELAQEADLADEDGIVATEEVLAEIPEEILEDEVSEEDIAELEALIAAADDAEDLYEEDFDEVSEEDEAAVAETEELDDDEDGWDEVENDLAADGTIEEPISSKVFQLTEAMEAEDDAEEAYAEDDADDEADVDLIAAVAEEAPDLAALDGLEELEAFNEFDDGELSEEDEAALMRDLAWADEDEDDDEADEMAFDEDDLDEDLDEEDITPVESAREMLGAEPDEDEAAMARIMSQTDVEMDQPENKVRRDAIAHLKAAYAATEAARALGETPGDDTEVRSAFRQDLDTVIRPVRRVPRPESGEHRTERPERPERPRVAPLRLVASQRVDIEPAPVSPAAISPVRPRRAEPVERPQAATPRGAGSFADYAEEVGATSLAELLEAAAAYTSYVEGVDEFSRPQIMKKVRDLSPDDFNREDGLRSFGTLLRQGRIMKIRNGRFQVSEQTRFRPEPRAAQG